MQGINLLRTNRNYRNFWLASVGSQLGNWFNEVALAQVTLALTNSPTAMGFVLLCRSLPSVILGPFAGPFVDRFPKKPILLVTDLVRAVFAIALSLSVLLHANWILYVDLRFLVYLVSCSAPLAVRPCHESSHVMIWQQRMVWIHRRAG
jgi:MFS family permease